MPAAEPCGPPIRRSGAAQSSARAVAVPDADSSDAETVGPPIPSRIRDAQTASGAAATAKARPTPRRSAFGAALLGARHTRDGRTCSWCKLVGKKRPEDVTLAPCGPCARKRGVAVLYCSRKCQREAWRSHKPMCAATPWSLQQHRCHAPGQKEYVRRLVQEVLIHTLAWKREPSHATSLLKGRILPYLLSYGSPPPGWSWHWSPAVRRYAARLTLVWARTLAYERESAVARGIWRDHVLPFLLDASTAVPGGWV